MASFMQTCGFRNLLKVGSIVTHKKIFNFLEYFKKKEIMLPNMCPSN